MFRLTMFRSTMFRSTMFRSTMFRSTKFRDRPNATDLQFADPHACDGVPCNDDRFASQA